MFNKGLSLKITILVSTAAVLWTVFPTNNSAWGLAIHCDSPVIINCVGTNSGDSMGGNGRNNKITGCGGNDVLSGSFGNDIITGDVIAGDCPSGGQPGADRIGGGFGDDQILHNCNNCASLTASDGHTDLIDCGPGDDLAFINRSVDHDVAVNCEHVVAG